MNQRAKDLMSKITLDTMSFTLFEIKPIPYEYYMKIYTNGSTTQNSTQTVSNMVDQDSQTDSSGMLEMWTQMPPSFSSQHIFSGQYQNERNGYGIGTMVPEISNEQLGYAFTIDNSLNVVKKLMNCKIGFNSLGKSVDYDRLNMFLQKCSITIANILNKNSRKTKKLQTSSVPGSQGFFKIKYRQHTLLKNTEVYKIYSNNCVSNTLFAMHRNKEEITKYFISIWNLLDVSEPIHILSSWCLVTCIEVHINLPEVLFAGLIDG